MVPNVELWDMPHLVDIISEEEPDKKTNCSGLDKYDLNHLWAKLQVL